MFLKCYFSFASTFLSFLPPNVIRTQTWKHEEKVILARLKLCQQNFELCQTSSDIWILGLKVFLLRFIMNYPSVLWQSRVLDSCHSLIPKKLKKLLFKSRNFFNFPFQLNHNAQVCTQAKKFAWWRYTLLVLLSFSTRSPRWRIQCSVIRAREFAQYSPVQTNTVQHGPIKSSAAQQGPVQPSIAQYSPVQPSTAEK